MTVTNLDQLREALQSGPTYFCFWKKDGSLRNAYGTTKRSLIPASEHPKGKRTTPSGQLCFYDLEKMAWRSLKVEFFECYITKNI